jgi:hypothetical protein
LAGIHANPKARKKKATPNRSASIFHSSELNAREPGNSFTRRQGR